MILLLKDKKIMWRVKKMKQENEKNIYDLVVSTNRLKAPKSTWKNTIATLMAFAILPTMAYLSDCNTSKERAYSQTMKELYEPVGNGGALHSSSNTVNTLWPTDSNPSFSRLAIVQQDAPQRRDMYQRMEQRYNELLVN